ncbi:MAG: SpaA isopeptide-forming pilin-related protein, partial [Candidatus Kaiserbacteria bacterium]|nr:SpaA isopeptide-forming pilin-related protein [Candidatus Kaiserbacteria bacterium]
HTVNLTDHDVWRNFGNEQTAPPEPVKYSIEGMKFEDEDGDGEKDSNEHGIENWTIHLEKSNGSDSFVGTNHQGEYHFGGLVAGQYTVCELAKSGWKQTFPSTSTDNGCYVIDITTQNVSGKDFGNMKVEPKVNTYSLSGMKFDDENGDGDRDSGEEGLSDWTITIAGPNDLEDSTTTDEDGEYMFTDLGVGTYAVCETMKSGWEQTYPNDADDCHTVHIYNVNKTGIDFGNMREEEEEETFSLSGMKFNDEDGDGNLDSNEEGLSGWVITITGADSFTDSDTTDGDGKYEFTGLVAGTYTVCETMKSGWEQTYPNDSDDCNTVVVSNANHANVNFGNKEEEEEQESAPTFTISGMKFHDEDEDGILDDGEDGLKDWTITIEGPNDFEDSTVTDNNGEYEFTGLAPGTYTLCEELRSGWKQTFPGNNGCHTRVITNVNNGGINFGNNQTSSGTTGGTSVGPTLTIDKTVTEQFVNPGNTAHYKIVVKNTGDGDALNVEVKDILPQGLTYSDSVLTEFFC